MSKRVPRMEKSATWELVIWSLAGRWVWKSIGTEHFWNATCTCPVTHADEKDWNKSIARDI